MNFNCFFKSGDTHRNRLLKRRRKDCTLRNKLRAISSYHFRLTWTLLIRTEFNFLGSISSRRDKPRKSVLPLHAKTKLLAHSPRRYSLLLCGDYISKPSYKILKILTIMIASPLSREDKCENGIVRRKDDTEKNTKRIPTFTRSFTSPLYRRWLGFLVPLGIYPYRSTRQTSLLVYLSYVH